jgi:serine/threonine protein kinase
MLSTLIVCVNGPSVGDNQPIRWKRRNSLGRGTFGEVILGMNLGTRKLMAVKEVNFGNVADINKKVCGRRGNKSVRLAVAEARFG